MNWVRHGGSTTFETESSYRRVARQGFPCNTAVARLGFKPRATTVLKSNLIRSIQFGPAVARRLKTGAPNQNMVQSHLNISLHADVLSGLFVTHSFLRGGV